MASLNVPIEMISSCNAFGEMMPIKFRMENEAHQILTALIHEIVYTKESHFAGMKTFEYGCKIKLENREQLVEVSYLVETHKWVIKKVIYG